MNKIVVFRRENTIVSIEYCNGEPVRIFPSGLEAVTLGSIYVGRVSKVKKELGAAFVDFLPGVTGFLKLNRPAESTIKEGDLLTVQVINEPVKTKGYTLSLSIEIAGEYCVVSDKGPNVHASGKISKEEAALLKEELDKKYPDRKHGGIIRTNASSCSRDSFVTEYRRLDEILDDIILHGNSRSLYSCLYKEKPGYLKSILDIKSDSYEEIVTDDIELFDEINSVFPGKTVLHNDERISLEAKYRIRYAMSLATAKKVNLDCGGYLVIEPTEAMTVIDVNSGKIDIKNDRTKMIMKVNFEAASMVASQLALRNISGMIAVDFINFDNAEDEEELLTYMRSLLKNDKCKCKVYGFTAMKFMEISRQKIRASIYDFEL